MPAVNIVGGRTSVRGCLVNIRFCSLDVVLREWIWWGGRDGITLHFS